MPRPPSHAGACRLRVRRVVEAEGSITIVVETTAPSARCPTCRRKSSKVHSHCVRTVRDLPVQDVPVVLAIRSRRFRCRARKCPQRIFTERLDGLAAPYARRTSRLKESLLHVGLALGGEAGARLVGMLRMVASPDTLLRLVRGAPTPAFETPRVLGVDDWAKRKGRCYGTILCDLEKGRLVDLLEEATADALADWLKAHPGVEIISRDRDGAYAEGAAKGAPEAKQVADRWHLLKNLGDAVEQLLVRFRTPIKAAVEEDGDEVAAHPEEEQAEPVSEPLQTKSLHPTASERGRAERRERRLERYQDIVALVEKSTAIREIARQLGISRQTVRKYNRAGAFPEASPRKRRGSILDPFMGYMESRWREGCHNGFQLLREIKALGYTGSRSLVGFEVSRMRKELGGERAPGSKGRTREARPPSPRRVRSILLRQPERLREEEVRYLEKLLGHSEELRGIHDLAQRFQELVREQKPENLGDWLEVASGSPIHELRTLAAGIRRDISAVEAALSLPWRNGQVEGQVNRLKTIKRQMYGRAKFDLLRARVLNAA